MCRYIYREREMYTYVYIYIYMCICIYIYIYQIYEASGSPRPATGETSPRRRHSSVGRISCDMIYYNVMRYYSIIV